MKDIKDKPESLKAFLKYRRMNWPHEWVEDHGAVNYTEFNKFWHDYHLPALKRIEELEKLIK